MPRGGARRDRLGGRVVSSTLGYRDAMLMVGDGYTFRQLAEWLGYKTPSAVAHAIKRGIKVSEIRPGLARVVLDKIRVLDESGAGYPQSFWGDDRDMFPATADIIRKLQPKAFIIENVKGLKRSTFINYYNYILLLLEFPEIVRKADETWLEHHRRLQQHGTSGSRKGLTYSVLPTLVNAANFGIPQRRERIFFVGFRHDMDVRWRFPDESHSLDALLADQWVTGDYWEQHGISKRERPAMPDGVAARVASLRKSNRRPDKYPWMTIRDALADVPEPTQGGAFFHNHRLQAGARTYVGHTGSPLDLPAKTLKAGDHGVPGGENMMVRDDGSVRYFTVRESARLQTFPDGFELHGAWSEAMRQLGNAVPVALAQLVASSVAEKLIEWRWRQEIKARGIQ